MSVFRTQVMAQGERGGGQKADWGRFDMYTIYLQVRSLKYSLRSDETETERLLVSRRVAPTSYPPRT